MKTFQRIVCTAIAVMVSFCSFSQQVERLRIEKALEEKRYEDAEQLLQAQLERFFAAAQYDSLPDYMLYLGEVNENRFNRGISIQKLNSFIAECLNDFILNLPKICFRERIRSQTILVRHHYNFVIQFSHNFG